ncbi:glycosyl hydrolase family 32 [Plantibacter sp. M259]|uniref:glycosyl hydrolase family 32 n=1 Tax=Plantibacter sp. M259 TaxID=2583822 RepID=UPI0011100F2B|nr:glycosyl hydrolase family 32 [Plantibacter sp. M259]
MLTVDDSWVWDFWLADDGERFHAFYLQAPTDLGDERRRHRAARIGHAVSSDLSSWEVLPGPVFETGAPGDFDETATWTGNVVCGDDGLWRMFYTGSRFLGEEPGMANIETVGVAVSTDLMTWEKRPGPITSADSRWYETWGTSTWKEEAWRDPWVFRDPSGVGWHMLITARSTEGPIDDRGVIGHAFSADLETWEVGPPLTSPGEGFAHLEVPQLELVDGRWVLLFSSTADSMTSARAELYPEAGTWAVVVDDAVGPWSLAAARPVSTAHHYSGRIVRNRAGDWSFLSFANAGPGRPFVGGIDDPVAFSIDEHGRPALAQRVGHG